MHDRHRLLREAAEKESLAAAFTRYARGLPDAFDGIPTRPSDCEFFWRGLAAQRFLTQVLRLRREMDDLADSCLATAENLRRRARLLREQAVSEQVPEQAPEQVAEQHAPDSDDTPWAR
ncbi:hypothetical protein GCM10022224_043880 [Nonomuraea antimicrobica]|uniref:Uncharacterized protein n=1 Tax=Nonomuraea antimicrobica TaxID=561173 RepID=A0ABP7C1A4_9ACTN